METVRSKEQDGQALNLRIEELSSLNEGVAVLSKTIQEDERLLQDLEDGSKFEHAQLSYQQAVHRRYVKVSEFFTLSALNLIYSSSEIETSLSGCRSESTELLSQIQAITDKISCTRTSYDELVELQSNCSKIDTELTSKLKSIEVAGLFIEVKMFKLFLGGSEVSFLFFVFI